MTSVQPVKFKDVPQQNFVVVLAAFALTVPFNVADVVNTLLAATVVTVGAAAVVVKDKMPPLYIVPPTVPETLK